MQYKQKWGNMTVSECMGDKSRSRILKTLQFGKTHSRYTIEKSIEVIDACHDHAKQAVWWNRPEELPYLSDIMQVIVD